MRIGFIGQGFIGKHMADDFVERGYDVVRYALEPIYASNKDEIANCDIVFIAVPTPTTPIGFDDAAIRTVLPLVGQGKIAVIKSTLLPGRTKELQALFPDRIIMHSPEFLREKSAKEDTKTPLRTIIGIPQDTTIYQTAAATVISVLPPSPWQTICTSDEAELIKYAGNNFLALKVIFMNLIYDAVTALGADYEVVVKAMQADPRIGTSHMQVIDQSGHEGSVAGRGAGGHCFPKDWAAFRQWYEATFPYDQSGRLFLTAVEQKNLALLRTSGKDLDLLQHIYGSNA
jgi:UDPglucose 6-dehydrogenase